jgi:hypothetical protein
MVVHCCNPSTRKLRQRISSSGPASLYYTVRPCLKKRRKTTEEARRKEEEEVKEEG